jgi:glycosyltransferase involved in cell wall biosynthesis
MPDMMNCIDILLLPSRNEGLPLVTVEALRSGTHVVAANVGGIIEVIGPRNVVNHGDNFIEQVARRCAEILTTSEVVPKLPECFDWDRTITEEMTEYKQILENNH